MWSKCGGTCWLTSSNFERLGQQQRITLLLVNGKASLRGILRIAVKLGSGLEMGHHLLSDTNASEEQHLLSM